MKAKEMSWQEFSGIYCDTQESTPDKLAGILRGQVERYAPQGFILLRCEMLDSGFIGQHTILPFGPQNSLKEIPTGPISPRGLASDMSVVIGVIRADQVPVQVPV